MNYIDIFLKKTIETDKITKTLTKIENIKINTDSKHKKKTILVSQ